MPLLEQEFGPYCCTAKVTKNPADIVDVAVDCTDFLAGDAIASLTVTADSGITVVSSVSSGNTVTARISGGDDGTDYFMYFTVTAVSGRARGFQVIVQVRGTT